MKKVIYMLICVLLLILTAATVATAQEINSGICGYNVTWSLDDNGTLIISGTGKMPNLIGSNMFSKNNDAIKNIIVEPGITSIGPYAFYGLSNVENVTIPESVTLIDKKAFVFCTNLKSIFIPNSVLSIEYAAFSCCENLENVIISNGVTSIGEQAFSYCKSLKKITIPETVNIIKGGAFGYCVSLNDVVFEGNYVEFYGGGHFAYCESLENIVLPNQTESIHAGMFEGCKNLKNVTIPVSVKYIDTFPFTNCDSLENIYYTGTKEDWENIDTGWLGVDFKNARIVFNAKDSSETPMKTKEITGFDLTKDGWSITNSGASFSYPDFYFFDTEQYDAVLNDVKSKLVIAVDSWKTIFGNDWSGNCFGMAASAVLNYTNDIDLKDYFSKSASELNNYGYDTQRNGLNVLNYGSEATKLIERMQISQRSMQFSSAEVFKTGENKDKFSQLIEYLNGNDPTPLVITIENGLSGHTLVTNTATKPLKVNFNNSNDYYAIQVYDPNTPYDGNNLNNPSEVYKYYDQRYLYINPKTGEWYYLFNPLLGYEEWWGQSWYFNPTADCALFRCYDLTKFSDKFTNNNLTLKPNDGKTYAFVCAKDISLSSGGKKFEISMSKQNINSDLGYMPFYGTTLDSSNDNFNGKIVFDDGKISVKDMVETSAVYFSDDNIMSISVDDASQYSIDAEENEITLTASKNASFDIVLDNEDSIGFEAIRIKGTASGGKATISLSDDGIVEAYGDIEDFDAEITVESDKNDTITFVCDNFEYLSGYSIGDAPDKSSTSFGSTVSKWAKEEVEEAFDEELVPEILVGRDLTKKVDRAEFAAIAVTLYEKLSGKKATEAENPFNDIFDNECRREILMAYNLNITVGTSAKTFEPDTDITREQMATMLTRAYKKSEFDGWTIADDDKYPLNFMGVKKFADDSEISDYAKESVYFMARWGIIQGIGDNKFAPKNTATLGEAYGYATREQAIVIALRSAKHL